MKKKAQSAMEFLVISASVIFFFTMFFVVIQKNVLDKEKEQEVVVVEELALSIKDEIGIALGASDGYSREFNIPDNIFGRNYEVTLIDNSTIYVKSAISAISLSTGRVEGNVKKGVNVIKKENGTVYLN